MAIQVKASLRKNPLDKKAAGKYYAQVVLAPEMTQRQIIDQIADRCTVTGSDVKAVLDSLIYVMKLEMSDGKIVQLGEFGNFRITFGSEGTKVEKDFNATKIRRPKYTFSPGKALRSQAKVLRFEKVSVEKGEGGNDSESPDEI